MTGLLRAMALPGLPALPRLSFRQILLLAAFAVIAALLVWIYGLRIDLPIIGEIGPKGLLAEKAELQADNKELLAQRNAARAESARIARANAAATEKADTDANRYAQTDRADADRFIAANRVRRCPAIRADARPQGDGASVPSAAGAVPAVDDGLPEGLVAVPESAVHICTTNTRNLILAREWALTIEANSQPAPQE